MELINLVLFIIGLVFLYIVGIQILAGIISLFVILYEFLKTCWEKFNSFGKIIFFGTPVLIATYFVFSFIFYTAIPYIAANEYLIDIFLIILCIGTYFSCAIIGWNGGNIHCKNYGIIPLIARIIFLLPAMPIIYPLYYLKQVFCKAFISNSCFIWNPHFITGDCLYYEKSITAIDSRTKNVVKNFESSFDDEIRLQKELLRLINR